MFFTFTTKYLRGPNDEMDLRAAFGPRARPLHYAKVYDSFRMHSLRGVSAANAMHGNWPNNTMNNCWNVDLLTSHTQVFCEHGQSLGVKVTWITS